MRWESEGSEDGERVVRRESEGSEEGCEGSEEGE